MNLYAYCRNNPLSYYDPSGYDAEINSVNQKNPRSSGSGAGNNSYEGVGGTLKGNPSAIKTVNDLSQEQIDALIKYSGDDYENINRALRGFEMATPENQATINTMKSALDNASLPKDMVLYRGTSTEALGNLKNLSPEELIGKQITASGFMSTSMSSTVASGTFSGNLQIKIEAFSGAHALDISAISQYSNEAEVLFNAGQKMTIISAESKNGNLYITVLAQ